MVEINAFILATAESDGTWIALIATIASAVVTGIMTWALNRKKANSDEYGSLLSQSAELREEMREDRENTKNDYDGAKAEIRLLRIEIADLQRKVDICNKNLEACQEIANLATKR